MALYRKYRPATFAEVVGQEHVTEPLSTALDTGRISHAYLFSGPRGCGKTSSARILARSLNCEQGPTSRPCGVCSSCVALGPGGPGNLDVIELDAASHGGVDDTRELRDRAFYAPAESRYRVFIVDEAHMVTTAGFNALLKIVEEPPAHLIFVFATTEPEKVLPTIRSRTHHYPFRLLPPATMRGLLGTICEQEGVPVDEAVYPLVIRAGGGSPRDSLSVLDQLLAGAGSEGVTYPRALALLGVTDIALIDDAVEALATADGAALFGTVDRVVEAGHDPRRFAGDLLERIRDLILLRAVPDAAERNLVTGPGDVLERMRDQAQRLGAAALARYAELLHAGLGEMRGATAPRLLLEVVCARMLLPAASDDDSATLQRLERVERQLAGGVVPAPAPGAAPAPRAAAPVAPAPEQPRIPAGEQGPPRRRGAEALAAIRDKRAPGPEDPTSPVQAPAPESASAPESAAMGSDSSGSAPEPDEGSAAANPARPSAGSVGEQRPHPAQRAQAPVGPESSRVQQNSTSDTAMREHAPQPAASEAAPQPVVREAAPQQAVPEAAPQSAVREAVPQQAVPEAAPQPAAEESTPRQAVPEVAQPARPEAVVHSQPVPTAQDPAASSDPGDAAARSASPHTVATESAAQPAIDPSGGSETSRPDISAATEAEVPLSDSVTVSGPTPDEFAFAPGRPSVEVREDVAPLADSPSHALVADKVNTSDVSGVGEVSQPTAVAAEVSLPSAHVAEVSQPTANIAEESEPIANVDEMSRPVAGAAETAGVDEMSQSSASVTEEPEAVAGAAEAPQPNASVAEPRAHQDDAAAGSGALGEIEAAWGDIRTKVREFSVAMSALLSGAAVSRLDGDTVVFAHPHEPLARRLSQPNNVEAVRSAIHAVLDRQYGVRWEVGTPTPAARAEAPAKPQGTPGHGAPARQAEPHKFTRPSQARGAGSDSGAASAAQPASGGDSSQPPSRGPVSRATPPEDDIPLPDGPDQPDDPGPADYSPVGYEGVPPASTPEEEREMLAESATPVPPEDRRDPDEVALELLSTHLGATRIEA